jgi:hypothetical protein
MSEPEDLILEGAHFATRVARDLWARHVADSSPTGVALADVRPRLELFVTALFQVPIAIGAREPPAPSTWLSRLAHRSARSHDSRSLGATDGERVWLPPRLPSIPSKDAAIQRYQHLAVQQAARLCRQTIRVFREIRESASATHDWFMLAEAAIVDRWIAAHARGLVQAVIRARAEALAERPAPRSHGAAVVALDRELRTLLTSPPDVVTLDLRADASPQECARWAEAAASRYRASPRHDRMASVPYWGAFIEPSTFHATVLKDPPEAERSSPARPPRVSEMRRRRGWCAHRGLGHPCG